MGAAGQGLALKWSAARSAPAPPLPAVFSVPDVPTDTADEQGDCVSEVV